jgi:hypothetical protein
MNSKYGSFAVHAHIVAISSVRTAIARAAYKSDRIADRPGPTQSSGRSTQHLPD